jgi:hypothetical protein
MDDIKWVIGFVIIAGILWLGSRVNKGEELPQELGLRATTTRGVLLPSKLKPATEQPGESAKQPSTYPPAGTVISQKTVAPAPDPSLSPLSGKLFISTIHHSGGVDREYVLIRAASNNTEAVPITGLMVRGKVGRTEGVVGRGWTLFFPGNTGEGETVSLKPGERAYILSARAPIGVTTESPPGRGGFQLNSCTGYFAQNRAVYPGLPIACPHPAQEPLPLAPNTLSKTCYDYLKTLRRCAVPPATMPAKLAADGNCQAHLFSKINYNQCVAYHKDEPGFYRGEWRLYLGRDTELWRDTKEMVELRDKEGRLIDTRAY